MRLSALCDMREEGTMRFDCEALALKPSLLLVRLRGVLDAGTSIELELTLSGPLKDEALKKVVLEVPELTFVSSSGLRVMMLIIKALTPRNGKLYLIGATAQIVNLIRMSGMTRWITLKDNLAECESD